MEREFSIKQCERVDEIYEATRTYLGVLTGDKGFPYDMKYLGPVADAAADILTQYEIPVKFPARTYDKDGNVKISDFYDSKIRNRHHK